MQIYPKCITYTPASQSACNNNGRVTWLRLWDLNTIQEDKQTCAKTWVSLLLKAIFVCNVTVVINPQRIITWIRFPLICTERFGIFQLIVSVLWLTAFTVLVQSCCSCTEGGSFSTNLWWIRCKLPASVNIICWPTTALIFVFFKSHYLKIKSQLYNRKSILLTQEKSLSLSRDIIFPNLLNYLEMIINLLSHENSLSVFAYLSLGWKATN